jgi:hypothetical protein
MVPLWDGPQIIIISAGLCDFAIFMSSINYCLEKNISSYSQSDLDDFRDVINKFIFGKSQCNFYFPWISRDLNDDEMSSNSKFMAGHAIAFCILHEYAHLLLNHDRKDGLQSQAQEFEADEKAVHLIKNKDIVMYMAIQFFKMFELYDFMQIQKTHPLSYTRLEKIYEMCKLDLSEYMVGYYQSSIKRAKRIAGGWEPSYAAYKNPENSLLKDMIEQLSDTNLFKPVPRISNVDEYIEAKRDLYKILR